MTELRKPAAERYFPFLSVEDVEGILPIAQALGLLRSRTLERFVEAYRASGEHANLPPLWKGKRARAISRMLSSQAPLWRGGVPTRLHLQLALWAFSPTRERLIIFIQRTKPVEPIEE